MFDALYPEATEAALQAQLRRPPDAPPPTPWFKDFWSAAGKAVPRAGAEIGRFGTSLLTPEAVGAASAPSMFEAPKTAPKAQLADEIREQDAHLRDAIKEFTPDPQTTGVASMIMHDVTRFVGKATAYSAMGGAPGAIVGMGLDEGTNETLKRIDAGVDPATAAKLGVVHGVASAAAVAVPVAGKAIAQTVGLAAVGGPGTYIAEQATAKAILQNADYSREANEINPFDPLGLGVSFLGPLLFGAGVHGVRARNAKVEAKLADERMLAADHPPGERTQVAQAVERAYTPEQVDAAHVAILQGHREATALHAREDIRSAEAHGRALDRASEQLASGQRVEVGDIAPVDGLRAADQMRAILRDIEARSLSPEVRAANFDRWFAGSKVVDAEGKPLVVYHGTADNFDAFDLAMAGRVGDNFGEAAYFTSNPTVASGYATRLAQSAEWKAIVDVETDALNRFGKEVANFGKGAPSVERLRAELLEIQTKRRGLEARINAFEEPTDGALVIPSHLSLKNPMDVDAGGRFWFDGDIHKQAIERAKAEGRDGVIVRNVVDAANVETRQPSDVFIVFDPKQAKSALGNSGRFDPNSASLTDAIEAPNAKAGSAEPAAPAEGGHGEPTRDYIATEADRIAAHDPNLMVLMEGMDHPVPAAELLAEIKAMEAQELADAPLLRVAAECALRG